MNNEFARTYKSLKHKASSITGIALNCNDSEIVKDIVRLSKGLLSNKETEELLNEICEDTSIDLYGEYYVLALVKNHHIPKNLIINVMEQFNETFFQQVLGREDLTPHDLEKISKIYPPYIMRNCFRNNPHISTATLDASCELPENILQQLHFLPFTYITPKCKAYDDIQIYIDKYSHNENFISALLNNQYFLPEFIQEIYETYPSDPTAIIYATDEIINNLYKSSSESIFGQEKADDTALTTLRNLLSNNKLKKEHIHDLVNSLNAEKREMPIAMHIFVKKMTSDNILSEAIKLKSQSTTESIIRNPNIGMKTLIAGEKEIEELLTKYLVNENAERSKCLLLRALYHTGIERKTFYIDTYKKYITPYIKDTLFIKSALVSPILPIDKIQPYFEEEVLPQIKDKQTKKEIQFLIDLKKEINSTIDFSTHQDILSYMIQFGEEYNELLYKATNKPKPTSQITIDNIKGVFGEKKQFLVLSETYLIHMENALNNLKKKYKKDCIYLSELEIILSEQRKRRASLKEPYEIFMIKNNEYKLNMEKLCEIYDSKDNNLIQKFEDYILNSEHREDFHNLLEREICNGKEDNIDSIYRYLVTFNSLYKKLDNIEREQQQVGIEYEK